MSTRSCSIRRSFALPQPDRRPIRQLRWSPPAPRLRLPLPPRRRGPRSCRHRLSRSRRRRCWPSNHRAPRPPVARSRKVVRLQPWPAKSWPSASASARRQRPRTVPRRRAAPRAPPSRRPSQLPPGRRLRPAERSVVARRPRPPRRSPSVAARHSVRSPPASNRPARRSNRPSSPSTRRTPRPSSTAIRTWFARAARSTFPTASGSAASMLIPPAASCSLPRAISAPTRTGSPEPRSKSNPSNARPVQRPRAWSPGASRIAPRQPHRTGSNCRNRVRATPARAAPSVRAKKRALRARLPSPRPTVASPSSSAMSPICRRCWS